MEGILTSSHLFAASQPAVIPQSHTDFYAAAAGVFAILLVGVSIATADFGRPGPSGRIPKLATLGFAIMGIAGLAVPLAVLAGFLSDTYLWRLLAFVAITTELLLGVFYVGVSLAEPPTSGSG